MSHDREPAEGPGTAAFGLGDVSGAVAGIIVLVLAAPVVETLPSTYGVLGDYLSAVYGIALFLFVILLGSTVFGLVTQAVFRD